VALLRRLAFFAVEEWLSVFVAPIPIRLTCQGLG
jgi:hypothetical protein